MQTRRRYHHGDLRAALLTGAEDTIREKGPAALSLRELARDLGVSHAAPSRHFKDKQALLEALALVGFDRITQTMTAALVGAGESFAGRLAAGARAYVDFAVANAELLDLMYSIKHAPEASEELSAASQRWTEQMMSLIAEGQRRGEVREGPLERVGTGVFSTLHGYATLVASDSLPEEMPGGGLDELVAYILRGCAPDK
ncbi:TetR/AcrR family transcriptional regulator [Streptomyces chiangmaiensis]|uniref:TetR/AcrR family transcriptional regulator n=1 Tax=Streptomyces chiangmaiensis TaxID=766497 RepID=A0ABU7FLX8_9ACTN|nr:TetR/AcrR family transcriptional regulator [Streptomyces chiangmaiensis]MED7825125.1 TetR/AcrR family transcriptional regulator [Streptomyces chiangmaiensis]